MMDYSRICELNTDEWIWVLFIFLSIMNIFGDECEKDFCFFHVKKKKIISRKIFIFTLFISLLIYFYLEDKRREKLRMCIKNKQNTYFPKIRYFAGIFIIIATLLFLYCQIFEPDPVNPGVV